MAALFVLALGADLLGVPTVPQAFLPDEDQGYFIAQIQAPEGASLEYTSNVGRQVETVLAKEKDIASAFSVGASASAAPRRTAGCCSSASSRSRSAGTTRSPPRPWSGGCAARSAASAARSWCRFCRRRSAASAPLAASSSSCSTRRGGPIENLAAATGNLVRAGNQQPELRGLFSAFTAGDPQLSIEIDRERVKSLNMPLSEVTDALQVYLGSQYVNDFDFNNRAYRVYVQADQRFRNDPKALEQFYARSPGGAMVPLSNLVRVQETTAPQVIATSTCSDRPRSTARPAPGFSSGQALLAMQDLAERTLPAGMSYAWAGQSLEEIKAGTQSVVIFGLGLLLVYLTLRRSTRASCCRSSSCSACRWRCSARSARRACAGLSNDIYCQVGLVMLIGLAAKNSILIVEFAEQLRERGLSIVEAAIEASRIRLRPILMTSFAFILGVLPLVFANGAGEAGRHSVGTAVAGGMLVSTILNLVFIPVLYVIVRTLAPGGHRVQTPMETETAHE